MPWVWQYRLCMSARSPAEVFSRNERAFRRRAFPDASAADWNDWRWQLRHRARTAAEWSRVLGPLSARERRGLAEPAAWRLLEAYIDAQAWGRHRLDLDVNRFNDLEFDLARAGLHPQFGLTRLVNDELRLPLQTYRGLSTGCIQHDQALQAASAWRNVLNHLSAENRAIAEPYAAWLAQFHHYGQMAPQKARPAPDLVVIYRA